jgi:hypothetical protein
VSSCTTTWQSDRDSQGSLRRSSPNHQRSRGAREAGGAQLSLATSGRWRARMPGMKGRAGRRVDRGVPCLHHPAASWERPRTGDAAEVNAGRRTATGPCHRPREALAHPVSTGGDRTGHRERACERPLNLLRSKYSALYACLPALRDYRWSSRCVTGILPGPAELSERARARRPRL